MEEECPVCYNQIGNQFVQVCENKHRLCAQCFVRLMQTHSPMLCPMCRSLSQIQQQPISSQRRFVHYSQIKKQHYLKYGGRDFILTFDKPMPTKMINNMIDATSAQICFIIEANDDHATCEVMFGLNTITLHKVGHVITFSIELDDE